MLSNPRHSGLLMELDRLEELQSCALRRIPIDRVEFSRLQPSGNRRAWTFSPSLRPHAHPYTEEVSGRYGDFARYLRRVEKKIIRFYQLLMDICMHA
jgi:hypothetical protein